MQVAGTLGSRVDGRGAPARTLGVTVASIVTLDGPADSCVRPAFRG